MQENIIGYSETSHQTSRDDDKITIRNVVPIFASEEDRNKVKKRIENTLYDIFIKYIG